jgi:hypothetical protein
MSESSDIQIESDNINIVQNFRSAYSLLDDTGTQVSVS